MYTRKKFKQCFCFVFKVYFLTIEQDLARGLGSMLLVDGFIRYHRGCTGSPILSCSWPTCATSVRRYWREEEAVTRSKWTAWIRQSVGQQ
jgi:hypothetical protein